MQPITIQSSFWSFFNLDNQIHEHCRLIVLYLNAGIVIEMMYHLVYEWWFHVRSVKKIRIFKIKFCYSMCNEKCNFKFGGNSCHTQIDVCIVEIHRDKTNQYFWPKILIWYQIINIVPPLLNFMHNVHWICISFMCVNVCFTQKNIDVIQWNYMSNFWLTGVIFNSK